MSDPRHLFGPTAHSLFSNALTGGDITVGQQEPAAEGDMSDPSHLFEPAGHSLCHNTSNGDHITAPLVTESSPFYIPLAPGTL
jgi:hypothetical protein